MHGHIITLVSNFHFVMGQHSHFTGIVVYLTVYVYIDLSTSCLFCVTTISDLINLIAIPEEGARSNHNLMLVTTERGGHIGFMEGLLPLKKTFMDRALMQFATAVFEHRAFQSTQCKVNSDP